MGQVLPLQQLQETLSTKRAEGKCTALVTTNGCFDILHVGHLRYLQDAKAQGDVLVVALNSDASVTRLKGAPRPYVSQDERAELLAGLVCVDYVVVFDADQPDAVLRALTPDIHVKGAQYTLETLPEADLLKELGTTAYFAKMVEGRSTTDIVKKVMNQKIQAV